MSFSRDNDSDSLDRERAETRAEMQDTYSTRVENSLITLHTYVRRKLVTLELLHSRGLPIDATASQIVARALTESSAHCNDAYHYASLDIEDYSRYMDEMLIRLIGNELRMLYCGQPVELLNIRTRQNSFKRRQRIPCGCVNTLCCWDTFTSEEWE